MYRALAALRRDVFPINPRQFSLLAEGPQDELERFQEQIDAYTGGRTTHFAIEGCNLQRQRGSAHRGDQLLCLPA